jgi:thioredoxin 1
MIEIESNEQYQSLLKKSKNVLIDMYAEWCGPCNRLSPHLEKLEGTTPSVLFVKLDIDQLSFMEIDLEEPSQIPCLVYVKNGEVVKKLFTSNINDIEKSLEIFN